MTDKHERFIAAYLRLNAYFTITNFIVHAGDDPKRIRAGHVGSHTEIDILGIRMPYSAERTGSLYIANHAALVSGSHGKTDVVIAEIKSGRDNSPNPTWKRGTPDRAITYVVQFIGLTDEDRVGTVAEALACKFKYESERFRFRYIIFAREPNKHYASKGVTYLTFRNVIEFLITERGSSWINCNLGVASAHPQWDEVLNKVFAIVNDHSCSLPQLIDRVESYLTT